MVGNSAGGAIALSLARARPDAGHAGRRRRLDGPSDAAARRGSTRCGATSRAARRRSALIELLNHDPARGDAGGGRRAPGGDARPAALPRRCSRRRASAGSTTSRSRRDELAAIAAPVLLVHGAQDRIVPLARQRAARCCELLPDVRAHVFGGCGHASPLERTDEFNRLVTTFLETDR